MGNGWVPGQQQRCGSSLSKHVWLTVVCVRSEFRDVMMWSDLRKRETCQATRFCGFFYFIFLKLHRCLFVLSRRCILDNFSSQSGFQIKTILVVSGDFI